MYHNTNVVGTLFRRGDLTAARPGGDTREFREARNQGDDATTEAGKRLGYNR